MMYINTRIFGAHANKGWWSMVRNPEIRFDLEYDGGNLSRYGYKMLQYWGTRGFCFKPSGAMAAMWETLMYKHGADYIATFGSGSLTLRYLNPTTWAAAEAKLKDYDALLKLVRAADGNVNHWYQLYPSMEAPAYDLLKVAHTKRRTVAEVRGTIRSHEMKLIDKLVDTIGHPLGDRLPAYLNDMRSAFSLPVVATQTDRPKGGRRTITRINR